MNDARDAILGKPFRELSTLDSTTASNKKPLVYGDIAADFRIVDRIGLQVELIPHVFGGSQRPTGQRGLFAYWRTGCTVQVPNAIRILKVR
jgi:HK97 family phage major capsid protein